MKKRIFILCIFIFIILAISLFFLFNGGLPNRNGKATETVLVSSDLAAGTEITEQPASLIWLGYYTGDEDSFEALQVAAPYLTTVSADVYAVQFDGSIKGSDEMHVVDWDEAHAIETYACISNYNSDPAVNDFDAELAHTAITANHEMLIEEIVRLAQDGGYAGINIDFENLAYSSNIEEDRAAFTSFIQELAEQVHANTLKLIISVPGKMEDSSDNTWAYPFDLRSLGETADYLQLMTYDEHGPWGEPGAVSGADWVEECLQYTTSQVNPKKLLIGLPAYGYDWDLTASDVPQGDYAAEGISWKDFQTLLEKEDAEMNWDSSSQSPSLTYSTDGHAHKFWFENEESIRIKTALVQKYDLAGVSMWALGKEDNDFWQAVLVGLE